MTKTDLWHYLSFFNKEGLSTALLQKTTVETLLATGFVDVFVEYNGKPDTYFIRLTEKGKEAVKDPFSGEWDDIPGLTTTE